MQPTESQIEQVFARWGKNELSELLLEIAGIAAIDVDLRDDGSPRVRIQLDGSVAGAVVSAEIRRALSLHRSEDSTTSQDRRAGLGRDLADIIAADAAALPPAHFRERDGSEEPLITAAAPPVSIPTATSLTLIAVEEAAGGISVRAADSAGGVAFSPVEDPRSLNQAVVSSVARLRQEKPLPRLGGVEVRDVDGAPVLTVILSFADGKRLVGSTLVTGGMPFTLGKAVWEALASRR